MNEDFLPLGQAIQKVTGLRPHITTLLRWANKGVDVSGRKVRLETRKIAGRRYTKVEWARDFIEATNETEHREVLHPRTASRRGRDLEMAKNQLDKELA